MKIFAQIFNSSIAADYRVRHVFEDLLVLADSDGVVDMTHEAIARQTNVPEELVRYSIEQLSQPDPKSRSKACQGKRIVLIDSHRDWGWRIVNYNHYRNLRDEDARRSFFRDYMRKYRKKNKLRVINSKQVLTPVNNCKPPLTHAEAEAEAEAEAYKGEGAPRTASHSKGKPSVLDIKDQIDACEKTMAEVKRLKEFGKDTPDDWSEFKIAKAKLKDLRHHMITRPS